MRSYRKNVLRLAMQNKTSFFGSILIIAIGIFTLVAMFDTLQNLQGQIDAYYEENRLADVFISVIAASEDDLEALKEIDGVEEADGKLSRDVRIICEGQEEIARVHLMSYDPDEKVGKLSLDGAAPTDDTIYIGDRMSTFYGFKEGDPISVIIGGQVFDFSYAGEVSGPEYIYTIGEEGAMVPDGETYDIASIPLERVEAIMSMEGLSNELGLVLSEGTSLDDVRSRIEDVLRPCGVISITDRDGQVSTEMIEGEMDELVATGTLLPALFLGISIYMLYMSLKKMIDHDQSLIGTMKAFGMTDRELIGSYMIEGLIIGACGTVLGSIAAEPFGRFMFDLYLDFFTLPDTVYRNYYQSRLLGLAIALVTAALAVLLGVRKVLGITPAMAMKSRAPAKARSVRLPGWITEGMSALRRLELRNMARNPLRGFLVILAVAFPFGLSSVLFAFGPTVDIMLDEQFGKIMLYDMMIYTEGAVDPPSLAEAGRSLEYVDESEGVFFTAMELRNGNLSTFGSMYGLNEGSDLWRIMTREGRFIEPPKNGVVINSRTAEKLHVSEGDELTVTLPAFGNVETRVPVAAVITEIFGEGCYADLSAFPHIFGIPSAANAILADIRDGHTADVKDQIRETSRVTGIVDASKISYSYEDMMGSMIIMIDLFAVVSAFAGFVLIYNISMISVKERFTEIGTLQVVGALKSEIDRMLLDEAVIYGVIGMILGYPTSIGVKTLFEKVFISDTYSITMIIPAWTYGLTVLMCAAMILAAWYAETRSIRKIALTDILKERD